MGPRKDAEARNGIPSRHSGANAKMFNPISRFRVWSFGPSWNDEKKTRRDCSRRVPTFVNSLVQALRAPRCEAQELSGRSQRGDSAWCKTLDHLLSLLMETSV